MTQDATVINRCSFANVVQIAEIFHLGKFQKYYLSNHFKENSIQYPPLQIQSLSSSKPECLATSGFIFDIETVVDSFSNYFHFENRVNYCEWSPPMNVPHHHHFIGTNMCQTRGRWGYNEDKYLVPDMQHRQYEQMMRMYAPSQGVSLP